jgi:hypothetical protein
VFPKWFLLFVNVGGRDLECHVFICDFGNCREEEYYGETKDKDTDGKVYPLNALERVDIVLSLREENVRG